jgi:multidrug efflux system outer membrane protein
MLKRLSEILAVLVILTGCAIVGRDYQQPDLALSKDFAAKDMLPTTNVEPTTLWWQSFNDPLLIKLVEEARTNNFTIEQAISRFEASRYLRRERQFDLFPVITASTGYTKTQSNNSQSGAFNFPNRTFEVYDAGIDGSWEVDVFGRVRRSIEQGQALEDQAMFNVYDAIRLITAELVREYLELRSFEERVRVTKASAQTQRRSLDIVQKRFEAGQVSELDLSRAKTLLSSTEAATPALEAEMRATAHRIALLLGKEPSTMLGELLTGGKIPLPVEKLEIGDPATLLKRRPDIRSAEMRLAAATAAEGVAEGDLFPRVDVFGSISLNADKFSRLGDNGTSEVIIAPRISWAAFDLGRVYQQLGIREQETREALAVYREKVLLALEEVESSLVRFARERERTLLLEDAFKHSKRAMALSQIQYEAGLVDITTVIDAQRASLLTEDELTQSQTKLVTSLVALWKALGAGVEV